ncbi:MAG: TIR domain-containing protein [Acidobacteriota bacterium]|nr:TIR domain-containing protein [Acidobacteriota bacterium]
MARVFISYSHADAEFARYVARCLRAAGHEPWLDEENIVAGEHLEEALEEAVNSAHCGVFLIGWDWIASLYSRKEIQLFTLRDKAGENVRRIGILRAPRADLEAKLPSQLSLFVTEEWIDGETDADVAAWRLACAVAEEKPGPRETWKERGRKFTAGPPPEPLLPVTDPRSPVAAELTGLDRPSLFCDRAEQWNRVESVYAEPVHHLLLVAGSRSEAHDYFVTRIDQHLKKEPAHERVRIDWPLRPVSRDSFRERIAKALDCRPEHLARELRTRMSHRNLILIHPEIDDEFDDEELVTYYAEWIPELLAEARPAMRMKSIQPIVWSDSTGVSKWLGLQGDEEKQARALTESLQTKLRAAATPVLTLARIDLAPITSEHVKTFCEDKGLSEKEQSALAECLRQRKRVTSRDILGEIDDFMRRRAARN